MQPKQQINPYAPAIEVAGNLDTQWPHLSLRESKRVRQLARDSDRIWWAVLGIIGLGLIGPAIFTIFFTGHFHSFEKLTRRHPELLVETPGTPVAAKSFRRAGGRLRTARKICLVLLLIEVVIVMWLNL